MKLFTDGGVVGRNPSRRGGTWAWCIVVNDAIVRRGSGIVTPSDLDREEVTNNDTEAFAAVRGLRYVLSLDPDWNGEWWTDSHVTLCRLTSSPLHKMPPWLQKIAASLRRGRTYVPVLCAGHPTTKEITTGRRSRNGLPTSIWNKWCDEECTKIARKYATKVR